MYILKYIHIYVYMYLSCMCICTYIYIYIEREREREREIGSSSVQKRDVRLQGGLHLPWFGLYRRLLGRSGQLCMLAGAAQRPCPKDSMALTRVMIHIPCLGWRRIWYRAHIYVRFRAARQASNKLEASI